MVSSDLMHDIHRFTYAYQVLDCPFPFGCWEADSPHHFLIQRKDTSPPIRSMLYDVVEITEGVPNQETI